MVEVARTRLCALTLLCVATLLFGAASRATAQSASVDGGAFFALDQRDRTEAPFGFGADEGLAAGGFVGAGFAMTSQLAVRFEWAMTAEHKLGSDGLLGFLAAAASPQVGGTTLLSLPYGFASRDVERVSTATVLLGHVTPRHHGVQLGLYGGVATIITTRTSSYPIYPLAALGSGLGSGFGARLGSLLPPIGVPIKTITHNLGAALGVDADVSIDAHWSVVPHVRAITQPGRVSLRPAIGLRAAF